MKKIIALLLVLTMVLSLAACGAPAKSDKITLDVIISQYGNYTQAWWTEFEKNFEAANTLKQMILDKFKNCDVRIEACTALCSFYAEIGGMLVGYESL